MMKILPRSAFGQTVLLISFLLFINQIVSYISFALYVIEPNQQQINQLLAKQVRVVFIDIGDARLSPKMAKAFHNETGIGVYYAADAYKFGLAEAGLYPYRSEQMSILLGGPAEVRISQGDEYLFWVRAPQAPHLWVKIPLLGMEESNLSPLIFFMAFIGFSAFIHFMLAMAFMAVSGFLGAFLFTLFIGCATFTAVDWLPASSSRMTVPIAL